MKNSWIFSKNIVPNIVLFALCSLPLHSGYIYKNGALLDEQYIAIGSCEEHFEKAINALKAHDYAQSEIEFKTVIQSFPDSSYSSHALYYLGVIKFEQSELDIANRYFTQYLHKKNVPEHYEDLFRYKLAIAIRLANGERRHLFGAESLPKLMTGRQIALDIFQEIIKTMPYQEIAAMAMLEKGKLLASREEFSSAIECYQEILRKFPKSSFAMDAFKAISQCHTRQLELEPHNIDALSLAEINVREARLMFPHSEEIQGLESHILNMKEVCASSLYDIGQLYERMNEPKAALFCYVVVSQKYPKTAASLQAYEQIQRLQHHAEELSLQLPLQPQFST